MLNGAVREGQTERTGSWLLALGSWLSAFGFRRTLCGRRNLPDLRGYKKDVGCNAGLAIGVGESAKRVSITMHNFFGLGHLNAEFGIIIRT